MNTRLAITLLAATALSAAASHAQTIGPISSGSVSPQFVDHVDIREYGAVCDYGASGTAHSIDTVVNKFKNSVVTISIGSPAVIGWAAHGLTANTPVQFTTTGSLPTGLFTGITYYVVGSSVTTNGFSVSGAPGGAAGNTSGTQSGVQTAVGVNGIQGIGLPLNFPADCNTNAELQVLTPNQSWSGPPHQPAYSKFSIAQPYIHVNTGAIQAGAENCVIQLNSHQSFSRYSLVFYGDGFNHLTSGLCTNTNTNNADGSFQAPIVYDRDVATLNMGNHIGCPSKSDGTAPTGALCGNVLLYRGDTIISAYNQNDLTGNLSDPFITNFIFASTACDSIWPDQSSAPPSGNLVKGRIEAGGGIYCPTGGGAAAIHDNGDRWNYSDIQIESWSGEAYAFEGNYSRLTIMGGFNHNVGSSLISGHEAVYKFNGGDATKNKGTRIIGQANIADSVNAQKYIVQYAGSNDDYQDLLGIGGGANAYIAGGSFFNGSVPAHVNMLSADENSASLLSAGKIWTPQLFMDAMNGGNYLTTSLDGYMTFVAGFARALKIYDTGSAQNWAYVKGGAAGDPASATFGCEGNSTNCAVKLGSTGNAGVVLGAIKTPSHTATCDPATIWTDGDFIYGCKASGTVQRGALNPY